MSFSVREGKFDVIIAAGPRVVNWPTVGVRAISKICADVGLSVGVLGGENLRARGVIPLPGAGGIVLAEDIQGRIHRYHGRAVVRVSSESEMPDAFPGWRLRGLVPLSTALQLWRRSHVTWSPSVAILGTGNRAFRFGTELLQTGTRQVVCIESLAQWGTKRFAGWEVEKRRFEVAGGRIIEGKVSRLTPKNSQNWELSVAFTGAAGSLETETFEVVRVVSAGPFSDIPGVREYPPASFLFEMDQTAGLFEADDVEGWRLEQEQGRWLGGRIARALAEDPGARRREELDQIYRRARTRLKRLRRHREQAFTPSYQGKWMVPADSNKLREFEGVPRQAQRLRMMASIECVEPVHCNQCEQTCPEAAIRINRLKGTFLSESDCTACGVCLLTCPSSVPILLQEREDRSTSTLVLPWRGRHVWSVGELATLVNRRGESLGSGRVIGFTTPPEAYEDPSVQLVQLEVPTHLLWEARGLLEPRLPQEDDEEFISAITQEETSTETVEITFNGERRLIRDRIPVTTALYETGHHRTEDRLFCPDGSCGLCQVEIEGVRKLACQTSIRRGMAVRAVSGVTVSTVPPVSGGEVVCPCLGVTREQILDKIEQGELHSPEALLAVTHVGEGRCRGQLCMESFRRIVKEKIEAERDLGQWIDWRFPWSNWVLARSSQNTPE